MTKPYFIVSMDIVTALGRGTEKVWASMLRRKCGIKALLRFPRGRYTTDFAAEIPAEVEAALSAAGDGKAGGRAYLLAHAVSRKALEEAVQKLPCFKKTATGLILSTLKAESDEFERLCRDPRAEVRGRFNPFVMACDLARGLGLGGPVLSVSGSCASGAMAIVQAAKLLARGVSETVLVVGVDVLSDFILSGFSSLAALDSRPCRPYDESRDGLSLGEGAGAILITSDESAAQFALAALRGWGITNDANHITAPSPQGEGLRTAISRALETAGLAPDEIGYVNGHGTGTVYNDEMEAQAIDKIFHESRPPVSSMKGYLGHTSGAAGVIETALCVRAISNCTTPASLGFERLGVGKPINVATEHLPLREPGNVITAKSGFGGINVALALCGVSSS